jgi:hypothetical protein
VRTFTQYSSSIEHEDVNFEGENKEEIRSRRSDTVDFVVRTKSALRTLTFVLIITVL